MSYHGPGSSSLASSLAEQCLTTSKDGVRVTVRDNPERDPITVKPETASHVAEQSAWVPLPHRSHPGAPPQ